MFTLQQTLHRGLLAGFVNCETTISSTTRNTTRKSTRAREGCRVDSPTRQGFEELHAVRVNCMHARTLQLQAIALPHPHRSMMAPSERAPQPEWRNDGSVGGWRGLSLHATRPQAIGDPLHCASEARDRWRRLSACPCATSLMVADACWHQQYHWCDDVQSLNSRPNCLMMFPTQSPPRVRQHVRPTAS